MKTAKDRIQQGLSRHVIFEYGGDITIGPSGLNAGIIEKMMQEHAKEVSMNFGKWVDMNAVRNGVDAWTVGSGKETQKYTTEQLFGKFMNVSLNMSELGDSWQQLRDESQKYRQKKQSYNTEVVMHLAGEYGFAVKVIAEYHLRLSHPGGKPLDYFPQRGRATWLGSNRWFKIKDIEAFIMDNWEKEPDYCEHCSGTGEGRADGLACNFCVNGVKQKKKDREPN